MRLFVALDIPDDIRTRIADFATACRPLAPSARWVKAETLHVTLKFIGEFREAGISRLQDALQEIRATPQTITFTGSGFFPTQRSPRVFWVGVQHDPGLRELAKMVDQAALRFGIAPEAREFTPHLTLARTGSGAPQRRSGDRPNTDFFALQQRLQQDAARDFGTMTASEFFLYESCLHPGSTEYRKLAAFNFAKDRE